ncbi:MAG: hypothetical protein M3R04_05855 [bacterium]|nr:hypothetical protein [bacterium]
MDPQPADKKWIFTKTIPAGIGVGNGRVYKWGRRDVTVDCPGDPNLPPIPAHSAELSGDIGMPKQATVINGNVTFSGEYDDPHLDPRCKTAKQDKDPVIEYELLPLETQYDKCAVATNATTASVLIIILILLLPLILNEYEKLGLAPKLGGFWGMLLLGIVIMLVNWVIWWVVIIKKKP